MKNNDLCTTCGKEVEAKVFGGNCELGHVVCHQEPCDRCGRLIGFVIDDDYCGTEFLICPDCLDKVRC